MGGGRHRLIVCANHHGSGSNGANAVFSDDHGATWQNGQTVRSRSDGGGAQGFFWGKEGGATGGRARRDV